MCTCSCNHDEMRCEPEPVEEGIPCGEDESYNFGKCNEGPGFCKTIQSEFGTFGICMGTPKLGIPCDDYDVCTEDDKCKVITTDDGLLRGECMGSFAEDKPCQDENDCTSNDRYGNSTHATTTPSAAFYLWHVKVQETLMAVKHVMDS